MVGQLKEDNKNMKAHIDASPDGPLYHNALESWKKSHQKN
jgi:hypothetical protein